MVRNWNSAHRRYGASLKRQDGKHFAGELKAIFNLVLFKWVTMIVKHNQMTFFLVKPNRISWEAFYPGEEREKKLGGIGCFGGYI